LNVFFREGREVGENLRCCCAFGEAGEHGLQRDARTLQDGFATDDLRVTDDMVLVVHGRELCNAGGAVVDGRRWPVKAADANVA
jgi:hypothetical protein